MLTELRLSDVRDATSKKMIAKAQKIGYTIERALCKNPMDSFNNIACWNYSKLPSLFKGSAYSAKAETEQEFCRALKQAEIEQKEKLCYIEICTDKMDMPKLAHDVISKALAKV